MVLPTADDHDGDVHDDSIDLIVGDAVMLVNLVKQAVKMNDTGCQKFADAELVETWAELMHVGAKPPAGDPAAMIARATLSLARATFSSPVLERVREEAAELAAQSEEADNEVRWGFVRLGR